MWKIQQICFNLQSRMSQDVNISVQKSTQIKFIKADIGLCPQKAKLKTSDDELWSHCQVIHK